MKKILNLTLIALLGVLAACSTTRFYPYESNQNVHPGTGGTRFTYGGIDVWFNGAPARRYAILGYIEDPRGLYADDSHTSVESGVLEKAREIGADALIEIVQPGGSRAYSGMTLGGGFGGFRRGGLGVGMGFGFPLEERTPVKYIAVRYLDKP